MRVRVFAFWSIAMVVAENAALARANSADTLGLAPEQVDLPESWASGAQELAVPTGRLIETNSGGTVDWDSGVCIAAGHHSRLCIAMQPACCI